VTGAMVVVGFVGWTQLGKSLLPDFKERDFLMHWLTKPGTVGKIAPGAIAARNGRIAWVGQHPGD
jgi:imidazolonepropionase-like amidohydrolase